jgi:DNA-binding CsgD family transcriptional regulator
MLKEKGLTEREIETAILFASGHKKETVANALQVTCHAVRFRVENIYKKLGISSKAELTRMLADYPGRWRMKIESPEVNAHVIAGFQTIADEQEEY